MLYRLYAARIHYFFDQQEIQVANDRVMETEDYVRELSGAVAEAKAVLEQIEYSDAPVIQVAGAFSFVRPFVLFLISYLDSFCRKVILRRVGYWKLCRKKAK